MDRELRLPDGRTLVYRECGEPAGQPLLCLHGALGVGDFDDFDADFRAHGWRAITPTLPGWGRSSPKRGRTLREWPADVAALLQAVGVAPGTAVDVLGISYGCVHALAVAMYRPELVRRLCLLAPHGPFDAPAPYDPLKHMSSASQMGLGVVGYWLTPLTRFTGWYVRSLTASPADRRAFVQQQLLSKLTPAEQALFAALPATRKEHMQDFAGMYESIRYTLDGFVEIPAVLRSWSHKDLKSVVCPLLVVVGDTDEESPPHGGQYIHDHAVNAASRVIETLQGGHMTLVMRFPDMLAMFAAIQL